MIADLIDFAWEVLIPVAIVLVLLVAPLVGAAMWLARTECVNDGQHLGVDVRWEVVGGCYYRTADGTFVPDEKFRLFEEGGR